MDSVLLQKSLNYGLIDESSLAEQIEEMENKKILDNHGSKIWQGKNGSWYTYLVDETGKRRLIKKSSKKQIEDYIIQYNKNQDGKKMPTFKEVFDAWVKSKYRYGEIKSQTVDRYESIFKWFFEEEAREKPVNRITENWLEDYIKRRLVIIKPPARNWNNVKTILKGTMKYARKHGYTKFVIEDFLRDLEVSKAVIKKPSRKNQVFSDEEVEKIIKECLKDNSLVSLGIALAFYTGLRRGELAALKHSDIQGNVMTVQRTTIYYKENGKSKFAIQEFTKGAEGIRKVIMPPEAVEIFQKLRKMSFDQEYIFYGKVKSGSFTNKLYRICDRLGIQRRSLHKARKTYATRLIDANVPESIIISQMGHTDISTTRGYYYFNKYGAEDTEKFLAAAF